MLRSPCQRGILPARPPRPFMFLHICCGTKSRVVRVCEVGPPLPWSRPVVARTSVAKSKKSYTTLSGGSLGSCVDEERSQLRELV